MKRFKHYLEALEYAIDEANKYQIDYGIRRRQEYNRDGFNVFMLPREDQTFGDDLMAERVKPGTPKAGKAA